MESMFQLNYLEVLFDRDIASVISGGWCPDCIASVLCFNGGSPTDLPVDRIMNTRVTIENYVRYLVRQRRSKRSFFTGSVRSAEVRPRLFIRNFATYTTALVIKPQTNHPRPPPAMPPFGPYSSLPVRSAWLRLTANFRTVAQHRGRVKTNAVRQTHLGKIRVVYLHKTRWRPHFQVIRGRFHSLTMDSFRIKSNNFKIKRVRWADPSTALTEKKSFFHDTFDSDSVWSITDCAVPLLLHTPRNIFHLFRLELNSASWDLNCWLLFEEWFFIIMREPVILKTKICF